MSLDHLDKAIDQVAARMTRVDDDAELAARIVGSLPERSAWALDWLVPRVAIVAVLAIGGSLAGLRLFDGGSTAVLRSFDVRSANIQLAVAVPEHRTDVAAASNVRRMLVEPSAVIPRTIDVTDFDRSLPALETAGALTLESLAPVTLPEDAPLTVSPLTITDLPLTAETISPSIEEQ